jgi:hypothetical protein
MDEFGYLSVLIAIILGLAITQILLGFRGLLHAREHVRLYWPSLVWSGLVIIMAVQSWWAMFGLRHLTDWSFLQFSVVLLQAIVVYMLSALVLPDFGSKVVDLRKTYFEHFRWFYCLLAAVLVVSLSKDLVIGGSLPHGFNLAFHLFFMAASLVMALVRNETWHKANTVFSALMFIAYIAVLFARLQ